MDEVKSILETLARNNGGLLLPAQVVDAAKDPTSPLHCHFEWDDSEAARGFREQQARALIRSFKVTIQASQPVEVRAYVSLPSDRVLTGGYRTISEVMGSDFLRAQLANDIEKTAEIWRKRAEAIGVMFDADAISSIAKSVRQA